MYALRRALVVALLIAPAVGFVALAFESGGYYPGATAIAALVALGALAAWALLAEDPVAGLGRSAAVILALLAGFAGWTLLSGTWSHSPGVALIEFDRMVLYVATFALFALAGRSGVRVRALIAILAGAAVVVALIGLAAWLLPHRLQISASFDRRRMSYPTGYWNTTALLAGLGVVWCLHLASSPREHWALRISGAAAIAPLVAVLGFTASRGALAATVAGVLVYALLMRSREAVVGLLACAPAAVASLAVVHYTPDLANHDLLPFELSQGHRAVWALALCVAGTAAFRALLIRLDGRLAEIEIPRPSRRTALRATAAALVVVVAVGLAIGAPARISHAYQQFASGPANDLGGEARLTNLSADGRTQIWRIALDDGFAPNPLLGSGAGTFAALWNRYRPGASGDVLVAHSLYIGTLGDLGLVGAALLFAALVAIVLALVRRSRAPGTEGAAWAGLLGGAAAWLVFAAVDWNWEMPACTIWLLAVGGLAASRAVGRGEGSEGRSEGRSEGGSEGRSAGHERTRRALAVTWGVRVAIAGAAAALALVPWALERSDRSLDRAIVDLQHDDCAGAVSAAAASRDAVPQRSEPYIVLADCAARAGRSAAALGYAASAVRRAPDDWEVYYTRGLVQAAAGLPPRASLRAALTRDPLGSYAIEASALLDHAAPAARRRVALRLPIPLAVNDCGGPTLADQVAGCGNSILPTLGAGPPVVTRRP